MEKLSKWLGKTSTHIWRWMRNITLALWLAMWVSNFSYSQGNGWRNIGSTEQLIGQWERNIEIYRIRVEMRNNNINMRTNETIDEMADRLWRQFDLEVKNNGIISYKVNEIKNILNINTDEPLSILQTALISIANTNKYKWLELYTANFSWNSDINFINAVWYLQFMNQLSDNGSLLWKNWEATLDRIIRDLQWDTSEQILSSNTQTQQMQNNRVSQSEQIPEPIHIQPEIKQSHIDDRVNRINSDYSTKVNTRNSGILNSSNETLDVFVARINKNFKNETDNHNSLVSRKISNLQTLLHNKYNLQIKDNPVLIIESALTELSKTEKYIWLLEYTENFSWNFDLNFIDAYWLVQYINDWNCNWALYGNDWALILQSLYDDLNNVEDIELHHENNGNNLNNNGGNGNINWELENNLNNDWGSNHNNNWNNDEVPDIEENNIELEWIALLSHNLSLDNLNWITYEEVWNTVNWFRHEWLRNAVMERLLHNDIIWAQRLLWMDLNCNSRRYPNYVAGRKLGHRELELMEKHSEYRRYMDSQEFLNNMEKVERAYEIENYEVKTAYLKFLSWEFDNGWLPYCIISKYDYKIYLFTADHKFLASYPVVTWAHVGNHPNDVWEHLRDPKNAHHTTPGWMYRFWWFFDKSSIWKDLTAVYGTDYGVLEPLEWQYNYTEEYSLWIHGFVMWRERMFYSQDMKDRLASNWCINFLRQLFWEMFNHLKKGSKVYVCRDDEINDVGWFGYNEWEIEMIEHFWRKPKNVIHWNAVVNRWYCKNNTWNTAILPRRILSHGSVVKDGFIWSELPYRYNLNFVTSSSRNNISNIFRQKKRLPYNKTYQKKYVS